MEIVKYKRPQFTFSLINITSKFFSRNKLTKPPLAQRRNWKTQIRDGRESQKTTDLVNQKIPHPQSLTANPQI